MFQKSLKLSFKTGDRTAPHGIETMTICSTRTIWKGVARIFSFENIMDIQCGNLHIVSAI